MTSHGNFPYCGAPPDPTTLLWRWNLDPILLVLLVAAVVAYAGLAGRGPRGLGSIRPWRRACFYGGWALGAAALTSPLCALSVSLFSARVGQHMVLEMIAAPLVALGRPLTIFGNALHRSKNEQPCSAPRRHGALGPAAVFAVVLWFWHAPAPYAATFQDVSIYWLMHATSFGAALWLWAALLESPRDHLGDFLAAALVTTLQMGFLGAVITFAARPVYVVHWLTTGAWGLTPLEDQQLGGVIMWIPAGVIFLGAIMTAMAMAMRQAGGRPRRGQALA
jgi:putative membrane protein